MGRKGVPVKTSKGTLEIKERMLGLAPRIRTALLLVDGVKSVGELEHLMEAAGVTPGALQLLIAKGLIRFPDEGDMASEDADVQRQSLSQPASPTTHHATSIGSLGATTAREHSKPTRIEPKMPSTTVAHSAAKPKAVTPFGNRTAPAALEVIPLLELESILGEVTKMEMETILGVATLLELSPTQMEVPKPVAKAPVNKPARVEPSAPVLSPLVPAPAPSRAYVERPDRPAGDPKKMVSPAYVLRLNLLVARAHLANALDQYLEIDGYLLKQKLMACESREEIEKLFRLVETALMQKMEKPAALRVMGIARAVLER